MVCLEGDYLLVFYDLRAPEFSPDKRGGLIRWMDCLEGGYLLVFYDLRAPEFSKRGGLIRWKVCLEGHNLVVHLYFAISGHLNSLLIRGVAL